MTPAEFSKRKIAVNPHDPLAPRGRRGASRHRHIPGHDRRMGRDYRRGDVMSRIYICEFCNLKYNDALIMVTDNLSGQNRVKFCSREHAARWLLRGCSLAALDRVQEDFGITPEVL